MLTLSRGVEPFWLNDKDAAEIGVLDNDWVEVYNDNGVIVTRAVGQRPDPAGHLHHLPCPGADHLFPQVAVREEPARRRDTTASRACG